jgi:hypothetical protein
MRWGKAKPDQAATPPSAAGIYEVGCLLPGTDETKLGAGSQDALEAGIASIRARDANFDPSKFMAWASTIYAMATAAWRTADPTVLRPVMSGTVYAPYSGFVVLLKIVPLLERYMASATAQTTILAAHGDQQYDTVIIRYAVVMTAEVDPRFDMTIGSHAWTEEWAFQRPATSLTHASGAVAVCPSCGAPANPDDVGHCKYCKANIASRTAGWLATRTATTMAGLVRAHAQMEKQRVRGGVPNAFPQTTGSFQPPQQPPRAG